METDLSIPDFVFSFKPDIDSRLNPSCKVGWVLSLEHDPQPGQFKRPLQPVEGEDRPQFGIKVVVGHGDVYPAENVFQGIVVFRFEFGIGDESFPRQGIFHPFYHAVFQPTLGSPQIEI